MYNNHHVYNNGIAFNYAWILACGINPSTYEVQCLKSASGYVSVSAFRTNQGNPNTYTTQYDVTLNAESY